MQSVDTQKIIDTIYKPIDPNAKQNVCMVWVPMAGALVNRQILNQKLLTPEGQPARPSQGDQRVEAEDRGDDHSRVLEVGDTRRENTQALVIPDMKAKGFELTPDNVDAATYFQQKLPALDTELAMYIQTATPDPTVTTIMACDFIPTPENPRAEHRLVQRGRHEGHACI